jgi:hypothetical protein
MQNQPRIPPIYLLDQNKRVYNFRCHLCRQIGLKVYQLSHETNAACEAPKPEANLYKTFEINQKHKEEAGVEVQRVRQYIDLMRTLSGSQFVPVVVEDAKE